MGWDVALEKISQTVANGVTTEVVGNLDMKDYTTFSVVVRADTAHAYDVIVQREGLSGDGAYGATDAGTLTTTSSGGNQVTVAVRDNIETPQLNIDITNNHTSSHDYDVFVGGFRV